MRQIRLLLQDLSAVVSALNRQTTRRRRREKELKARLHAMETRVNDLQQAHNKLEGEMRDLLQTRSAQQTALGGCPTSVLMNMTRRIGEMDTRLALFNPFWVVRKNNP